ncbi:MAG: Stp1/IreP family PP2C-type Ser/Thr phosphatase [Zetaproteobacteria bacterium]|nr:MAG: Stp1/IreP family PP2C-type Ser/Thr phosphatase [Zetaproteobacteria bacterium]
MVGTVDVGIKRKHNEDAIALVPGEGLAILADGMGGHNAGEVASGMAVETVHNFLRGVANRIDDKSVPNSQRRPESSLLQQAVMEANRKIHQHALRHPECSGMGTTIITALFHRDRLTSAHVGDSRMYRLRDEYLTPVTEDHSLVQEQMRRGLVTPIDAQTSRVRNIVTRALGVEASVEPEVIENQTRPGDIYLMCSDGLTDVVPDEAIRLVLLEQQRDLKRAMQTLVDLANDAGGPDNISIILIRVRGPFTPKRGLLSRLGF